MYIILILLLNNYNNVRVYHKERRSIYYGKNLTYRSSSKGVAEQYGISLSKKMLTDMGITPANRKVLVNYDEKTKTITITKK